MNKTALDSRFNEFLFFSAYLSHFFSVNISLFIPFVSLSLKKDIGTEIYSNKLHAYATTNNMSDSLCMIKIAVEICVRHNSRGNRIVH